MNKASLPSLARIRKEKGFTQKQLADALSISVVSVSNYESGRNDPTLKNAQAIAKALGVTVDELLN